MKAIERKSLLKLVAVAGLLCLFKIPAPLMAQQENHCFSCHTNPRRLIEITRTIAKVDPQKPGASPETKGEG